MHMQVPELGAAVQLRKHLAGIEQALRVEGAFQPLLLIEVNLGEHVAHQVALLDAHAVFAGNFHIGNVRISVTVLWWIFFVAVASFVLFRTKLGGWITAVGGDVAHGGKSPLLITADAGYRRGKPVSLKVNADEAAKLAPGLEKVLINMRVYE